ncbi:MAG: lasso peptide biosynthesis B2 protein [Acidobacteriaceae bacterium]
MLLACVRWPHDEATATRIRSISVGTDWDIFLRLVEHHRVLPLVQRALRNAGIVLPQEVDSTLKRGTTRNAYAAMRYLAEARRLSDLLEAAGIPVRLLKGVPLSQRAFEDWSVRDVGDLDLLIAPEHEEQADALMLADGLRRREPAASLTPRRRRSYRKHAKDYTYEPGAAGFEIDLHWRLFRNPRMDGNDLAAEAPEEEITVAGVVLHVLPLMQSFLYLCVHGTLDGWHRIKPLADIAALWRRFSESERVQSIALARAEGIAPELAAALLLARYLDILDPAELPDSILLQAADRLTHRVLDRALAHVDAFQYMPGAGGAGSWELKRYELGLRRSLPYRLEILKRVLFRPRVWERFNLPDALYPLYSLLSPVEWLLFHGGGRRLIGQAGAVPGTARQSSHAGRWSRWRAAPWREKKLLTEATLYLIRARVALRVWPVRAVLRRLERPLGRPAPAVNIPESTLAIKRIRDAVLAVSRHAPARFVCFPQALAAHAMLRRRGIPSRLHYGVRRSADGQLRAHTWLEAGGRTILGGETSTLFSRLHAWSSEDPWPP